MFATIAGVLGWMLDRTTARPSGTGPPSGSIRRLDGEQVPGAGVGRGVAQLRHRPGLDLADPLTGQVEVLADLFERAGLAPVEAEAQLEDLLLTGVERRQQAADLVGQQGHGS